MNSRYIIAQCNPLATLGILAGCREFTRVEGRSFLDIGALHHHNPTLYDQISKVLMRGYRTTNACDAEYSILETLYLRFRGQRASYIGTAHMRVYLEDSAQRAFMEEVIALKTLMGVVVEVDVGYQGGVYITAPVTKKRVRLKHGGSCTMPSVASCFTQIRPMTIKYLKEDVGRQDQLKAWRSKGVLELDWSKP